MRVRNWIYLPGQRAPSGDKDPVALPINEGGGDSAIHSYGLFLLSSNILLEILAWACSRTVDEIWDAKFDNVTDTTWQASATRAAWRCISLGEDASQFCVRAGCSLKIILNSHARLPTNTHAKIVWPGWRGYRSKAFGGTTELGVEFAR